MSPNSLIVLPALNTSPVCTNGTVHHHGFSLWETTAEAGELLSHLRAFMSFGVKISLVTAGRGSSENVARCKSCTDETLVGDRVTRYAAPGVAMVVPGNVMCRSYINCFSPQRRKEDVQTAGVLVLPQLGR